MNLFKIAICLPIFLVHGSTDSTTSCFLNCGNRVDSDGEFKTYFDDCIVGDENIDELIVCLDDAGRDSIKILNLIRNRFTEIPEDFFSGMTSLENMIFYFPTLEEIPLGIFQPLTSLETLEVRQANLITTGVLDGLGIKKLILDVDYDDLDSLEEKTLPSGILNNLNSLEELDIANQRMDSLPEGFFDGLTSLKDLDIHNNDMRYLPDGIFDDLSSVEFLDLSYNDLIDLSPSIFSGMDSLLELDLKGNYLACYPDSQARDIDVDDGVEVCDDEDSEHGLTEEEKDGENDIIGSNGSSDSAKVFPLFSCAILVGIISIVMM